MFSSPVSALRSHCAGSWICLWKSESRDKDSAAAGREESDIWEEELRCLAPNLPNFEIEGFVGSFEAEGART